MTYRSLPALGEVYNFELPVIGNSKVTIPTSKMATDATNAAAVSIQANSPALTAAMARGMSEQLPLILDKTIIEVEKRLSVWSAEKRREIKRGAFVAVAAMGLVIAGSVIVGKRKSS